MRPSLPRACSTRRPHGPVPYQSPACAHDAPRAAAKEEAHTSFLTALQPPSHPPLTSPLTSPLAFLAQIPPGLAGSESENSYTSRMGMSKEYKK